MPVLSIQDDHFDKVVNSSNLVLVDFWAEWCGPCRALGPKLEEISNEMEGQVQVAKINIDENRETAQKFGIRSIPTMILFKDGKEVDTLMGNLPKEDLVAAIQKHQ